MKSTVFAVLALLLLSIGSPAEEGRQEFAALGDFRLESGERIVDCRVGYRTFGQPNRDKTNVVLVPTWFGGTSSDLEPFIGPGKLLDTSGFFVVAVDSLSNGVSTSPSNSKAQPRMRFPRVTIGDMANSQYQLLTRVLHVERLKAVVGISMGGMQTFEWMVSYPAFMEKAVPILGSPRLAPYDLLLWQAEKDAIRSDPGWNNGNYREQPARGILYALGELLFTTPERYNRSTRREEVLPSIAKGAREVTFDANDRIRQLEAMMALDVSSASSGSMQRAAAAVGAEVLVVVSKGDRVVTPDPAREFARLLGADVLELQSDCGHLAFECEADSLASTVHAFLAK